MLVIATHMSLYGEAERPLDAAFGSSYLIAPFAVPSLMDIAALESSASYMGIGYPRRKLPGALWMAIAGTARAEIRLL